MKQLLPLYFLILFSGASMLQAQDLHFTDYRFSPLLLNPAKSGAFYGTYRISGQYRTQWSSFINDAFNSKLINFDNNLAFGLKDHHWVGWGFNLVSDIAGELGYTTSGIHGSAAYHFAFDEDYKDVLTLGVQYGQLLRKFNKNKLSNARFDDQVVGELQGTPLPMSMDPVNPEDINDNYSDLNIGLLYRKKVNELVGFEVGGAMHHLLGSEREIINGNRTFNRLNIHGALRYQAGNQFILEPSFTYSGARDFSDFSLQLNGDYLLRNLDNMILHFGTGMRIQDALEVLVGATYRGWRLGIAYDLTISSASVYNNSNGAFEIGLQRIFNVYKRPEPDPSIFCPRF